MSKNGDCSIVWTFITYIPLIPVLSKDFELISEPMDENEIANKSLKCHKNKIKQRIREAAFRYLQEKQQNHSKIKEIQYQKLETQNYTKSPFLTILK